MIYSFSTYEKELISLIENNTNGDIEEGIDLLTDNIKEMLLENIDVIEEEMQVTNN